MIYILSPSLSVEDNLFLERTILEAETYDSFFWIWRMKEEVVVVGKGEDKENLFLENIKKDNIPVIRRHTGGGSVFLDGGAIVFSFITSLRRFLSITYLMSKCINRLNEVFWELGIFSEVKPPVDIAFNNKKIAGVSGYRSKNKFLFHGSILYNVSIEKMERYLKIPNRYPDYRMGRSHKEFVVNLASLGISRSDLEFALFKKFIAFNLA